MTLTFFLLGASHSDYYLATAIKQFGYKLITSGNYAHGLSNCLADEYRPADYSDYSACLAQLSDIEVDYIIPSANDFSFLTSCKINEQIFSKSTFLIFFSMTLLEC